MSSLTKLFLVFGCFLIVCGVLGWAATGFEERGKTAILSGSASGAMILVAAFLSKKNPRWGGFLGLFFTVLFGGTFVWRASIAWSEVLDNEPKLPVAALLSLMAIGCIAVTILAIRTRFWNISGNPEA